jgi:hypothetical protein
MSLKSVSKNFKSKQKSVRYLKEIILKNIKYGFLKIYAVLELNWLTLYINILHTTY